MTRDSVSRDDEEIAKGAPWLLAQAPLKVYWVAIRNDDAPDSGVVDAIVAQCHRWSILCLDLGYRSVELDWLRPIKCRVSCSGSARHPQAAPSLIQCVSFGRQQEFELLDGFPVNSSSHRTIENLFCEESELSDLAALSSHKVVFGPARSLKKLVLMFCDIPPELITVLRGLSHLTFLILDTPSYQPPNPEQETALFDAMTMSCNSDDLCPNLMFDMNPPTRSGYGLEALRLFGAVGGRGGCPAGIHNSMQMLREEGLDAAFLDGFALQCLRRKGYFQDYSFHRVRWDCYEEEADDE
ncbi:hypothetical protein B0H19DRAFT_1341708 [Mycena capillaripes]|nr:hypothetical protein B0H19DRAFT_1341708 [Mycena capillaripes]